MTAGSWKWLAVTAGLAVGAAYLVFSYVVAASERPPALAVLVGLVPLAVIGFAQAARSRFKVLALLGCAAVVAWVIWYLEALRSHVALVYFVQHVGAMAALGLTFGSTLGGTADKALCSQIAALVTSEPLDPTYLRYTWQVTWAWTMYFGLTALLSAALFSWAPVTWWSFFANIMTPVLTGAMFVGEYLVRVRMLPDRPHMSIAGTIAAYQRFKQGGR